MLPNGIFRVLKENGLKSLTGRLGSYSLDNIYMEVFFEESLFRMFWILHENYCREFLASYYVSSITLRTYS